MIRRKKRMRGASGFDGLAFPKGQFRTERKDREDRQFTKAREICRYKVFMWAGGCCEHCGVPLILLPSAAKHEYQIANIHEEPPRSQGGDPTNPFDCVCLCYKCSAKRHALKLLISWSESVINKDGRRKPVFQIAA